MHAQSWRDTYENDEWGITKEWLEFETSSWLTDERIKESHKRYSGMTEDRGHFYRVAERGEDIVGFIHFSTKEDGNKRLEGLYVAKSALGTGLAQRLISEASSWLGNADIELEVISYNDRAKAFYRKQGFVELPGENELFKGKLPNITMIRKGGKQ
jgi:ribosomal protein S18 acetylase RimI-like enzyme